MKTETKSELMTAKYVSYAKDIFCAIHEKEALTAMEMQLAISLVKQAKDAFELQ